MQFPKPAFMPPVINPGRTTNEFTKSEFKLERFEEPSLDASQVTQLNRGQLIASKLTPGQERDLNFIFKAAFEEPTATNVGIVKSFLERWKPPKDDLVYIKQSAEKVVKSYVDKPDSRALEFSKNWDKHKG